jgi:hypothetical protein
MIQESFQNICSICSHLQRVANQLNSIGADGEQMSTSAPHLLFLQRSNSQYVLLVEQMEQMF